MNRSLRIEIVPLKDLERVAGSFAGAGVVPVSTARVLSQMKNPYGQPDDPALAIALDEGRPVGYHGLLPGMLEADGKLSRVLWATTFFVSEKLRGKGIGRLLIESIRSLGADFVVTGMTREAEGVYRRAGLKHLGDCRFLRLRPESMLHRTIPAFSGLAGQAGKRFHRLWGRLVYGLLSRTLHGGRTDYRFREVPEIRSGFFRMRETPGCRFYRGPEAVNWMIRHLWVRSREEGSGEAGSFHFSALRDSFRYIPVEIRSHGGRSLGAVIFSISRSKRGTVLKTLDFEFFDPQDRIIAPCLALRYAGKYDADRVDLPCELTDAIPSFFRTHVCSLKKRSYVYSPKDEKSPLATCAGR
ncbi:MAG: GNAT family N-acetyltransferase, partial [Nitrospirae bacterium]|nr:GNAT family N-acetyltransferase [Nitrospirota bacterium]